MLMAANVPSTKGFHKLWKSMSELRGFVLWSASDNVEERRVPPPFALFPPRSARTVEASRAHRRAQYQAEKKPAGMEEAP